MHIFTNRLALAAMFAAGSAVCAVTGSASAATTDATAASILAISSPATIVAVGLDSGRYGARGRSFNRSHGNRSHGNRSHGNRGYGNRGFNNRGYNNRGFQNRGYSRGYRGYNRGFYGGGFRGSRFYRPGFRTGFGFGGPGYYYGGQFYRRGFDAGDAFLLSAGVIGGAILIDRALDANDWNDSDRRGYQSGGRSVGSSIPSQRSTRAINSGERNTGERNIGELDGGPDDFDRDTTTVSARSSEPEVLLGSLSGNYQVAYQACVDQLRSQLAERGIRVAVPAEPQSGGNIGSDSDGRDTWRFNAEFTTSDGTGASFLRRMTCEADEVTIGYLEIN